MSLIKDRGRDFFAPDTVLILFCACAALWLAFLPSTPAQAGLAAFMAAAAVWLKLVSRGLLDDISVERAHAPRVFQNDTLSVALRVRRGTGMPVSLLQIEDQFHPALQIPVRNLIPFLAERWTVDLHYRKGAERHRGLYVIGPIRLLAGDPLGVFESRRRIDLIDKLVIYPQADPLPDFHVPGPLPALGASLDHAVRLGQGETILGVREYVPGDAPASVHWRTSARRAALHVVQRNSPIQSETAVLIDLTRRSRFGLGADSAPERAIQAAVSILSRVHEARHRSSLCIAHREALRFPAGGGLAHLHLMLDRLAILNPEGETDYWSMASEAALALPAGSRAVFIAVAALAPLDRLLPLLWRLDIAGVAADCVLIDERPYMKIYRDQEPDLAPPGPSFDERVAVLRAAGARVWPIRRGEDGPFAMRLPEL
jgi:uncharacterized protein (DUF58 family)